MRILCESCKKPFTVGTVEDHKAKCEFCGKMVPVPESPISPGVVLGDFVIESTAGKGGMGEVYVARQLSLDREVALKVLKAQFSNDAEYTDGLFREAKAAAKLSHPNIVQAYAVGEDNGVYYFAMEFVKGETMKQVLKREHKINPEKAAKIVRDVTSALDAAWREQKLVHQDIKPDNIMLDGNNYAKLADLGLARVAENDKHFEVGDEVMGTPQYISPEQLTGVPTDVRSDIYSLGATFYQFVTGEFPYRAANSDDIAKMHVAGKLTPPKELNPDLPDAVNAIIVKMMARNPEDRYQTPALLISALDLYLNSVKKNAAVPVLNIKNKKPPVIAVPKMAAAPKKEAAPAAPEPPAKPAAPAKAAPQKTVAVDDDDDIQIAVKPGQEALPAASQMAPPPARAANKITPADKTAEKITQSEPKVTDSPAKSSETPAAAPGAPVADKPADAAEPDLKAALKPAVAEAAAATPPPAVEAEKEKPPKKPLLKRKSFWLVVVPLFLFVILLGAAVTYVVLHRMDKLPAPLKQPAVAKVIDREFERVQGWFKRKEKAPEQPKVVAPVKAPEPPKVVAPPKPVTRPEYLAGVKALLDTIKNKPDAHDVMLSQCDHFFELYPQSRTDEERQALQSVLAVYGRLDELKRAAPARAAAKRQHLEAIDSRIEKQEKLKAEERTRQEEIERRRREAEELSKQQSLEAKRQAEAVQQAEKQRIDQLQRDVNALSVKIINGFYDALYTNDDNNFKNALADARNFVIPAASVTPDEKKLLGEFDLLQKSAPAELSKLREYNNRLGVLKDNENFNIELPSRELVSVFAVYPKDGKILARYVNGDIIELDLTNAKLRKDVFSRMERRLKIAGPEFYFYVWSRKVDADAAKLAPGGFWKTWINRFK